MQWFRQLILVVFVFGVGLGLGAAWKLGWIPVELSSPNTGALTDQAAEADPSTDVDDPEVFAAQSETPRDLPEPEPRSDRPRMLEPTPDDDVPVRQPVTDRVVSAAHSSDDWMADAAPARPKPAGRPARIPEARDPEAEQRPARKEVRLVAAQEPAPIDEPAKPQSAVGSLAEELKVIDGQIEAGELLPAHRALSKLYWNQKQARDELMPRLEKTARAIFFEPRPHFVEPYVVQANDQLRVIASKQQLSWEYLAKLNRTDPRRIQLGQKLKVLKGPFAAVVDLNDFALTVHLQGYYVHRYPVGIGKDGASPVGKFAVLNKVENPQYTGPDGKVISGDDPSNPLGERWIDLGESYGIHGTIEPESIGKAASRGCIRMRDKDVIEVYDFLIKGSEVVIRNK